MSQALAGVRVVDLSRGPAGGLATMILADFGAEVLVVDPPGNDPLAEVASAPMWRRGKKTVQWNLKDDDTMGRLHELLAGADVLVCNWRPSALARADLTFDALHERHPHLIFCHISGFGPSGPCADYPGYEHVVAARTGRMLLFSGIVERPGPVFSALQVGVHACAQAAASGILSALLARGKHGPGRLVETSMLQAMLAYEQGAMIAGQLERFEELWTVMQGSSEAPMPSLFYHPAQAGDGRWMQFGNLLPHLFDNFLIATDLVDITIDEDFDPVQLLLRGDKQDIFRARMLKRIQERPADDWMADFIADGGIVAAIYETTQQAMDNPDVVANGHVVERGEGVRQLGPLARLLETPGMPGAPEQPGDDMAVSWAADPRPPPSDDSATSLPLEGLRVVELATIIAAPLGACFLADMGAEVIKVEQIGGDPYNGLAAGTGYARVNAGKRSISVDLKSDQGREVVASLIGEADVVIHNYRPGVAERLGIGYEDMQAGNPSLVYVQVNGYGPDGPGALRPSTHPVPGAAMGGVMYQMGERLPDQLQDVEGLRLWTRRLMRANEVNPDPNTAAVVCTSALLGLSARQRTGAGQRVLVDMLGANAYANHDDFVSYPGKTPRLLADELGHGLSSVYRLYRCASDQWVFLALVTAREKQRFIDAVRGAGLEPPTLEEFDPSGDGLADALASLFERRDADFWEALLASQGLGCVRADAQRPGAFWLDDEQVRAMGFTREIHHPAWGDYRRHGAAVHFDGRPPQLGPPPRSGLHNAELMTLAGFDGDSAEDLEARGVLFRDTSD